MAMAEALATGRASKRNGARRSRLGGMADTLSIATDLGLCAKPLPNDVGDDSKASTHPRDLIAVLRELTINQRDLANLQVELQGRQEDLRVAHLTRIDEMKKKSRALRKAAASLRNVILSKDRIIARLQQPYFVEYIPVEIQNQQAFLELMVKAARDCEALSSNMDIQWSTDFALPASIWADLLRPIPAALASCTRYFAALTAMREAIIELYKMRATGVLAAPTEAEIGV